MENPVGLALVVVATSALTVTAVLMIAWALMRGGFGLRNGDLGENRLDAVFLFDGRALIDANERGEALLKTLAEQETADAPGMADSWSRLSRFLAPGFPDLTEALADLPARGTLRLVAGDESGLVLGAEWRDGVARLTLGDTSLDAAAVTLDRLSLAALDDELVLLRAVVDRSPLPCWRENPAGQVIWANGAYLNQLGECGHPGPLNWPLPALFAPGVPGTEQRQCLNTGHGRRPLWFDVHRMNDARGQLVFALPADAAQRAEQTRQEFVQTLTKTFATLPIGMALFDRTRRLQIFNPALTDLTGLEPEFLLSRPGVEGFMNRMRDKRVLPEPRDYADWLRRLLEVEKDRPGTEFEETWSLPAGQTFRVSARPHPDGALAFLVEDITPEVHMSRNSRAELETSQTALNLVDQALAVFAPDGMMLFGNDAFSDLWMLEGEDTLAGITLSQALENWRDASVPGDLWDRIEALANRRDGASATRGIMTLHDGEAFRVTARRAANGIVVIAFSPAAEPTAEPATGRAVPTRRSASARGAQVLRASA